MLTGWMESAPLIASTTFYLASSIIIGGGVSGLVVLGLVQVYARERIQRKILFRFFGGPWRHYPSPFGAALMRLRFGRYSGPARNAANLLHMPERVLCRLYYRQISGQFLAAVNGEATGNRGSTPVIDWLSNKNEGSPDEPAAGSSRSKLETAVRQIDILQAYLGDAVIKSVMRAMTVGWSLLYTIVGLAAQSSRFETLRTGGAVESGLWPWLVFWGPSAAVAVLIGLALGLCAAACGLVAFSWLDRFTAAK